MKANRPALRIPFTALQRSLIFLAVAGLLLNLGLMLYYWPMLPDRVPRHFNFGGKADAWGNKELLVLYPVLGIVMLAVFTGLSLVPRIYNYPLKITEENAARQYALGRSLLLWLGAEIEWMLLYIDWGTIRVAVGEAKRLDVVTMLSFLFAIIGTTGVYFVRAYKAK